MRTRILITIFAILVFSVGLAWISTGFQSIQGWPSFLAVTSLGAGFLLAGWCAIRSDSGTQSDIINNSHGKKRMLPTWLGWLLIGAAMLRLGAGIMWFVTLPNLGYHSAVEKAGYVMADAFNRDRAAWDLAQSEKPLSAAFSEYRSADQYGGMLYGSALIYRYMDGENHQPLLILVITAAISALAVLFTWAFAYRIWDGAVAATAASIVALFPDAVLLGSSQMREAIMMSFTMMAFYGLVRIWQDRSLTGWLLIVLPILIAFPLSPLFGLMLAGMLGVFALFLGGGSWIRDWRVWAVLIGLVVLGLVVVAMFGEQILPGGVANPVVLLQRWLKQAGRWQAYNAEHASGWMQKIFRSTPVWAHTWLLLFYGVARPFLPAALFDSAASIWQAIAVWRSLGWTLLLPFLIIAPLVGWRRDGWRSPGMGLSILVWTGILISSFRGGGDQWDNPRYRVIWIGLHASLAAWVWVTLRRDGSPWIRRVFVGVGLLLIWWAPWYLRRVTNFEWPIQDVFATLGLGVVSILVYLCIDFWYERKQAVVS